MLAQPPLNGRKLGAVSLAMPGTDASASARGHVRPCACSVADAQPWFLTMFSSSSGPRGQRCLDPALGLGVSFVAPGREQETAQPGKSHLLE